MTTSTMTTLAIHTSAPRMPLLQMIGEDGYVQAGRTPRGEADCMAGWLEPKDSPLCRDRNVITGHDDEALLWMAKTLVALGYEVVCTTRDEVGDDVIREDLPMRYIDDHHH